MIFLKLAFHWTKIVCSSGTFIEVSDSVFFFIIKKIIKVPITVIVSTPQFSVTILMKNKKKIGDNEHTSLNGKVKRNLFIYLFELIFWSQYLDISDFGMISNLIYIDEDRVCVLFVGYSIQGTFRLSFETL